MAVRRTEGAASGVERWLENLGGPVETETETERYPGPGEDLPRESTGEEFKCPTCDKPRTDYGPERERYDEDFDYFWGGLRLPMWIALIWQVPWRQRLDIFVIGFIVGMVIAGIALLWGLLLSRY